MNDVAPSEEFANEYLQQAKAFIEFAKVFREQSVLAGNKSGLNNNI
jgi:uncharacterized protein YeaO (DUF488 family)